MTERSETKFTNSQVDRLGERLRGGQPSADDLRLLDQYRRSFTEPYEYVVSTVRSQLRLDPTGRPAKSTASIVDKLRRESARLSQMQDIAGCRIVVPDVVAQDSAVQTLVPHLGQVKIFDRRQSPSHGYRAVHIVVHHSEKNVEIQIRSVLQHMWAELSEKAADVIDPAVKYGGGPEWLRTILMAPIRTISELEELYIRMHDLNRRVENLVERSPDLDASIKSMQAHASEADARLKEYLKEFTAELSTGKGS